MHSGFGAQPAVGVVAGHTDGRTLDSGYFAIALIDDLGLDAMPVRPFQIHTQQHGSPVLGFGAARPGLNVEKRIVRIHLAREHALEFQLFYFQTQAIDVSLDLFGCAGIRLFGGQFQELRRVAQGALESIQAADDLFELGTFLPQLLGAIRVVPNAGLLELALYFLQTLVFVVVIKDTSSKSRCAPRDL